MSHELLTTDQLRDRVEKVFIEHIKLCQDKGHAIQEERLNNLEGRVQLAVH